MTSHLIISILAIIFSGLVLFIVSKLRDNQVINVIGTIIAGILYGVFLDFGTQFVNESAGRDISMLGSALLIGGSVYFFCSLFDWSLRKPTD